MPRWRPLMHPIECLETTTSLSLAWLMRSQIIGEHREAALLAATCRGVERPGRGVVVLGQHPELVGAYFGGPPLRLLDERAADPTPLERLLDPDLIQQHFGAPTIEARQPVGEEKPADLSIPAGDEEEGVRMGEEVLPLLSIPGHAFVEQRVELRGELDINRDLPAHGQPPL